MDNKKSVTVTILAPGDPLDMPAGSVSALDIDKVKDADTDSATVKYGTKSPITISNADFPYQETEIKDSVHILNTGKGDIKITATS